MGEKEGDLKEVTGLEEGAVDVRANEGSMVEEYDGFGCGRLLYLFAIAFNLSMYLFAIYL